VSEEIIERRNRLRAELREWIEARIPDFLMQLGGPEPTLPLVEDFVLSISLSDGADPHGCPDYYPMVCSPTAHHHLIGLLHYTMDYLTERDRD
jgi:hypothetical protein